MSLGNGTGLPHGNFTISYWIRVEGQYERSMVLESDYNLDVYSHYTIYSIGYTDYWNFGGMR